MHRLPAALAPALFLAASLALAVDEAGATADGPDAFRIAETVTEPQALRIAPDAAAPVLAEVPPGADGLLNFGCIGGLSLDEWMTATEDERAAAAETRWCRVGHDRRVGWLPGPVLIEGSGDDFRGGGRLSTLAGSEWEVIEFGADPIPRGTEGTLHFDGKRVSGRAFCNRFTGPYTEGPGTLTFGEIAGTRMACPEPLGSLEMQFHTALGASESAVATHLLLALFDADGTLLITMRREDTD